MATIKHFDNYASTLASSYTAGGATLSLTAAGTGASALPSTGDYYLVVDNDLVTEEIFKVTSGTSGAGPYSITVAGAQAGTTNQNHSSGAVVKGPILTRAALDQMRADQNRILTVSAFDALAAGEYQTGDRVRLSPGLYEAVYDGSAWQYFYGSIPVTRPPSSGWSWDNQGSSTISSANGFEHAEFLTSSGVVNMRCRYRTAPSTPYTVTAAILPDYSATTNLGWNIGFRDGTGKLVDMLLYASSGYSIQTNKWTTTTSLSAAYKGPTPTIGGLRIPSFLRITDNGTNLIFETSADKLNWTQFDSRSRTDFLASGPTQIFYGAYTNGGQVGVSLIDWTIT